MVVYCSWLCYSLTVDLIIFLGKIVKAFPW